MTTILNSIKNLVLIGGGHSHAIALKLWGSNPLPNVKLTLVSNVTATPYSGMLPGYLAGFYTFEETHINLPDLAKFAGAKFCLDTVIGLDLEKKQVFCQENPPISFDYLSIDIGSTPNISKVPGAAEYAIPIKPVPRFLKFWDDLLQHSPSSLTISIVGGGAGGVELALNCQHRLQQIVASQQVNIHLFQSNDVLLPNHNQWVSQHLEKLLISRGVNLHLNSRVTEVLPHQVVSGELKVDCDYVFWVTQASAPSWLAASGLATDTKGFILVSQTLQSLSHPFVFAAGDVATMSQYPRPKAGVFAVRQGKPLYNNWCNLLLNQPLEVYLPQKRYLSLIGTGDKQAIASWGNWGWRSPLCWYFKDYLDRQFMQQFYFDN